jgi:hypothetical protein
MYVFRHLNPSSLLSPTGKCRKKGKYGISLMMFSIYIPGDRSQCIYLKKEGCSSYSFESA